MESHRNDDVNRPRAGTRRCGAGPDRPTSGSVTGRGTGPSGPSKTGPALQRVMAGRDGRTVVTPLEAAPC
ncbi:hypothetical protein ACSNOK_16460 [Streptomyces sp. URMC 126]|uniref:hypothetical protein n=1 Tax=Streptomyces sp. URMC 126 TaxID=3423401 RepID=UPI003F1B89E0